MSIQDCVAIVVLAIALILVGVILGMKDQPAEPEPENEPEPEYEIEPTTRPLGPSDEKAAVAEAERFLRELLRERPE